MSLRRIHDVGSTGGEGVDLVLDAVSMQLIQRTPSLLGRNRRRLTAMTDDMWGTGDYRAVAEKVTSIADVLVPRAGIVQGMAVLDVACGTGNASIPAARLGREYAAWTFRRA